MGNRVSSRLLVGRDQELSLLLELARRASEGAGGAALVLGEAGIGKSRLVSEFARRAGEQGALVLVGECVDLAEAELPYAPIVGALRAVVRERSEPDLAKLFGGARGELSRLLPELGAPAPGVPGSVGQTRLFELVLGVLSRLGQERPVALVIEDVHWADSASLDLLAFLVRNQRSERLATVVTFRSDELSPEHPVRARLAELERGARAQRIELEPLSSGQVAEQVLDITGTAPTAEFSQTLHDRAQGNPFFIEELLAAGDGGELPVSLRDALLVRPRRLSDRGLEIVGVAAVAGRTVDHRLLRELVAMKEGELIAALREAVAEQVLISDGLSYSFRHALLREAVYSDLVASQRAPLHAALATALTAQPGLAGTPTGSAAEIAHHWHAAGEIEAALAASVEAGAEAERVYAIQEARRQYQRVLELWDRVAEPERITGLPRSALLVRAADSYWLAGDETRAVAELTKAALELGEETFFAFNALEARGRYELVRGDLDAADRHLAAAETMGSRSGDPMWAGPVAAARAEVALWRGDAQMAAAIVHKTLAIAPERQCLQHTSELHAVGARALAELALAARAGRQDAAANAGPAGLLTRLEDRLTSAFPLGAPAPSGGRHRTMPRRGPPRGRRF
jgi:predicted ATPase